VMTWSPSQVLQNYHQDSDAGINPQINLELYDSYVYLFMSYYFHPDDTALKNFAKNFQHQSQEEREHAEKLMRLQNQRGSRIFLQDIKKPDLDDWRLATDKNNPSLCDFMETHYLDEQAKSSKQQGDHVTNLCKMGAPILAWQNIFLTNILLETVTRAKPHLPSPTPGNCGCDSYCLSVHAYFDYLSYS
uniref:Ferritin n=1 Tax=Vombatus ursinus TaxID=29139 RepID=A0A4X2LCB9_VOMUR